MTTIAIIGAGLAGLTVAHNLKDFAEITLFEKSRGVGGRISTRRAEPYFFDHGAQYFKASTDEFKLFIKPMIKEGVLKPWEARFVEIEDRKVTQKRQWGKEYPHYVGEPGMNAMAKYLSKGLQIHLSTCVKSINKHNGKWALTDEKGNALGEFDWVISSVPPQQASVLLPSSLPFYSNVKAVTMQGCFSLMLGFEKALPLEFDAALVRGENISWISVNASKPGRHNAFCLVAHSDNNWADEHIEDDPELVMDYLCEQTSEVIGHEVSKAEYKAIHRWRYANIVKQTGGTHFIDTTEHIGICGDWFIQGRVESAFTSGFDLANKVLGALKNG